MSRTRVNEIDLLRFVAALAVVMYHFAFRGHVGDSPSAMEYPALEQVAKYGYLGVELFFMISGFVILMTAAQASLATFLASRALRLYPAFWAACTLTFLATLAFADPGFSATPWQYLVNMTMLSEFVGIAPIDGVYWSLFVEIRFYLLVAIVLALGQIRHAQWLCALWLLASVVLEFARVSTLREWLITDYSAFFVAGAVCYLIWRDGVTAMRVALLVLSWLLALFESTRQAALHGGHYATSFDPVVIAVVVSAFFVVFYLVSTRALGRFGQLRWTTVGALTYPLYLIHQNVGYMLINRLHESVNRHVLFWGLVATMIFSAHALHKLAERRLAGMMSSVLSRLRLTRPAAV